MQGLGLLLSQNTIFNLKPVFNCYYGPGLLFWNTLVKNNNTFEEV